MKKFGLGIIGLIILFSGIFGHSDDRRKQFFYNFGHLAKATIVKMPNSCTGRRNFTTLKFREKIFIESITINECRESKVGDSIIIIYTDKFPDKIYALSVLENIKNHKFGILMIVVGVVLLLINGFQLLLNRKVRQ